MDVIPAGTFLLAIKNIVLVPDGILVPTLCAIRKISFAKEFPQMAIFGPLIRCLYSRDSPIVGSMTNWLDVVSEVFFSSNELLFAVSSTLIPGCTYALVL